jgi:hypothetical protein
MRSHSPEPDAEVLDAGARWSLLREVSVGYHAVLEDSHPEIFPVNCTVVRNSVVFRTGEGTMLHAAVGQAAVAVEADGIDPVSRKARSVHTKGHADILEPTPDLLSGIGFTLFPWQAGPKDNFVRGIPTAVSGRRFAVTSPLTWWNHLDIPRSDLA